MYCSVLYFGSVSFSMRILINRNEYVIYSDNMNEHEKKIREICDAFRKKGFIVYRLDKRHYPDAIFVENGDISAIEVETGSSWRSNKQTTLKKTEFKKIYVFRTPRGKFVKYGKAYELAFKLRKEGKKLLEIQKEIQNELEIKIALSTLSEWLNGKSKPTVLTKVTVKIPK